MFYKKEIYYTYAVEAVVEADSLEEAKEMFENDNSLDWEKGPEDYYDSEQYSESEDGEDWEVI